MSKKRAKKKISWKRIWPFYLMALPGFLYMLMNNYIPMFGISIAFKKLNFREGIWGSPWVGFKNFKFLVNKFFYLKFILCQIITFSCKLLPHTHGAECQMLCCDYFSL